MQRILRLIDENAYDDAVMCLNQYEAADADDRKNVLHALRDFADDQPTAFTPLLSALTPFLIDDERAIRLTTAKLFVVVAKAEPKAVVPVISSLVGRLTDEDEFYYVRARSAEALGYVALEHPDAVASPEVLAELRIGLSFDKPEVKEKLAKALEYVALGNPRRLRHQVSNLADHLDDENALVRYHLCTALVVIGCAYPATLVDGQTAIIDRLADENAYIRGRAAEALGLLVRGDVEEKSVPTVQLAALKDDEERFVAERVHFATSALESGEQPDRTPDGIGTVEAIRETTDDLVEEITSPDCGCPHCGGAPPKSDLPICPQCGAPY